MERKVDSECHTVRLVDIEKEILKGKRVKPSILDEEPLGPPKKKVMVECAVTKSVSSTPSSLPQTTMLNTSILNQTVSDSVVSAPTGFFVNPFLFTNMAPEIIKEPAKIISTQCITAANQSNVYSNKPPSILRKPTQVVTKTVPVEKMWSEIQNGVRFLHPSNLDHDMLHRVTDSLKTNQSLKNTIISLPNSVYLVPLSCFKGAQLPPDSMVSLTNYDKAETVSSIKNQAEATIKLKHHCWNMRRHRKLDLDGFTAWDRLGFYKAEAARAKRCQKNLDTIIESLTNSVMQLKKELTLLQLTEENKPQIRQQKKEKCLPETEKSLRSELVDISVSKLGLADYNTATFIDHRNFEHFRHYKSCVFVYSDIVITEIILHGFPKFRMAVKKGVVKVMNETDYVHVFEKKISKNPFNLKPDPIKHAQFIKFIKDSRKLLDIISDHNYASNKNYACIHS